MPRPKKASGQAVDKRNGARLKLVGGTEMAAPPAPSGFLPAIRDDWDAYWLSAPAHLVDPADIPALRRLFNLYDERERSYRAFRKERLTGGSTGQLVVNPLGKQLLAYDAVIAQLEDRFGLTPMARMRLGVQLGEAVRSLEDLNRPMEDADGDDDPRTAGRRDGGVAARPVDAGSAG